MRPTYEAIPVVGERSFLVRSFEKEGFLAPFHYHPEYELTLITRGKGTRFMGTQMDTFQEGDLVLVSSNVPHCWRLDPNCEDAGSIVIQFRIDFLSQLSKSLKEIESLSSFLEMNKGAFVLKRVAQDSLDDYIKKLLEETDEVMALLRFFHLLNIISKTENKNYILSNPIETEKSSPEKARIVPVLEYIQNHYNKKIDLQTAASIANLSPNAFCKKFKQNTRKTFMEVVIDYRINKGLQLLTETDQTIATISDDCGFGDVSNFFRAFRKRHQITPLQYRERYKKRLLSESDNLNEWTAP